MKVYTQDTTVIKCRGKRINTYPVPHLPHTLTRTFIGDATIYFSCEQPIAIKYRSGRPVMTFQSFGEITTQNKNILRHAIDYITIPTKDFNGELFLLLSKP